MFLFSPKYHRLLPICLNKSHVWHPTFQDAGYLLGAGCSEEGAFLHLGSVLPAPDCHPFQIAGALGQAIHFQDLQGVRYFLVDWIGPSCGGLNGKPARTTPPIQLLRPSQLMGGRRENGWPYVLLIRRLVSKKGWLKEQKSLLFPAARLLFVLGPCFSGSVEVVSFRLVKNRPRHDTEPPSPKTALKMAQVPFFVLLG